MKGIVDIGIAIMLVGFALVFIGALLSDETAGFGGLILIGPVPLVFGTSPGITVMAMVLGLILMVAYFLLMRRRNG